MFKNLQFNLKPNLDRVLNPVKVVIFFALIYVLSISSSCEGEDCCDIPLVGTLNINFVPKYGSQALNLSETFTYQNMPMRFQRVSMYLSNFSSENAATNGVLFPREIESKTINLDFSNILDKTAAEKGISISLNEFPAATYTNLTFGIGINTTNNNKIPSNFDKKDPLSDEASYWEGWKSYIFCKTEGRIDTNNDGQFESSFSYHTGANDGYRPIKLDKSFEIKAGQTTNLTIEIDYQKVLEGLDLIKEPNTHSLSKLPIIIKNMDNFKNSFK